MFLNADSALFNTTKSAVCLCKYILLMCLSLQVNTVFAQDPTSFYTNFNGMKLNDQNAHQFSFAELQGKITLLNFIYTQCSQVCLVQTHELAQVFNQLPPEVKQDVAFVSISLDSLNDTPATLKLFAKKQGADLPSWHFLSGEYRDIQVVAKQLRLFEKQSKKAKKSADQLASHATGLWLIDKNGILMQRYVGQPVDVERLQTEIAALEKMQTGEKR